MDDHLSKPVPEEPELAVFDEGALLERIGGNEVIKQKIILAFLNDVPNRLVLLKEALRCRDQEGAILQAHTIKGSSRNVGAESLGQAAERVEKACQENALDLLPELIIVVETRFAELKTHLSKGV